MTKDNDLDQYLMSNHHQISEAACPIIQRLREIAPHLDWGNITYDYIRKSDPDRGSVARFTIWWKDMQVVIKVHPAYFHPSLQKVLDNSLCHELAHVGAVRWKGRDELGHGFYWGYFMIALGQEPFRRATHEEMAMIKKVNRVMDLPGYKFTWCNKCQVMVMAYLPEDGFEYHCEVCRSTDLDDNH